MCSPWSRRVLCSTLFKAGIGCNSAFSTLFIALGVLQENAWSSSHTHGRHVIGKVCPHPRRSVDPKVSGVRETWTWPLYCFPRMSRGRTLPNRWPSALLPLQGQRQRWSAAARPGDRRAADGGPGRGPGQRARSGLCPQRPAALVPVHPARLPGKPLRFQFVSSAYCFSSSTGRVDGTAMQV